MVHHSQNQMLFHSSTYTLVASFGGNMNDKRSGVHFTNIECHYHDEMSSIVMIVSIQ